MLIYLAPDGHTSQHNSVSFINCWIKLERERISYEQYFTRFVFAISFSALLIGRSNANAIMMTKKSMFWVKKLESFNKLESLS